MNTRALPRLRPAPGHAWLEVMVVNADNYRRPSWQVGDELRAIATGTAPGVIAVIESLGNDLPRIPGYHLIRDTSTLSRSNIAAYVRDDLVPTRGLRVHWRDYALGWRRTKYPKAGSHEPRADLRFAVGARGRLRFRVGHFEPANAVGPAKAAHMAGLVADLVKYPRRPVLLAWDANGVEKALAKAARCRVVGDGTTENLVGRGFDQSQARKVTEFAGGDGRTVVFRGDHGHVTWAAARFPATQLEYR